MRKSSLSSVGFPASDMLFISKARRSKVIWIAFVTVCGFTFLALILSWTTVSPKTTTVHVIPNGGEFQTEAKSFQTAVTKKEFVRADEPEKIILFWTPFFGGSNSYMLEEGDRLRHKKCPVSNCILSEDRGLWKDSSAFVFHAADTSIGDLPPQRLPHQYYVFFNLESPVHSHSVTIPNFYNLTFTYRFDSDIVADNYLQYYRPKMLTSQNELDEKWEKKTKGAVAMVSNCVDFRMDYVTELAKYFPIDVYGDCGNLSCPKKEKAKCEKMMGSYKFYLSFENSICKDYLTEKAIRGFMSDAIPVFMGGAPYAAIFPPESFLSVNDFPSPKALAERMRQISSSKPEYLKYFQFRLDAKKVQFPDYLHADKCSLCKLCEILNAEPPIQKVYPDMTKWWSISTQCNLREPQTLERPLFA